jgi:hypothetical protein
MQQKIEQHPKYTDEIKNDPIQLLLAIRESMHAPARNMKPLITATSALKKLLNYKQNDESLDSYVRITPKNRLSCSHTQCSISNSLNTVVKVRK